MSEVDSSVVNTETIVIPPQDMVQVSPEEEAAKKFSMLLPFVNKLGATMSAKGLTRVLFALTEFPLGASKPKLLNDGERQLFHILQELNGAKSIVIQSILKRQMELDAAQKAAQSQTTAVSTTAESEGSNESSKEV